MCASNRSYINVLMEGANKTSCSSPHWNLIWMWYVWLQHSWKTSLKETLVIHQPGFKYFCLKCDMGFKHNNQLHCQRKSAAKIRFTSITSHKSNIQYQCTEQIQKKCLLALHHQILQSKIFIGITKHLCCVALIM